MEIPGNPWFLAVAAIAALAILVIVTRETVRKRSVARRRADNATLQGFYLALSYEDRAEYKGLPNQEARLNWLAQNHADFVQAAERYYPEQGLETGAACHLDVHLVTGATRYTEFATAVRIMRNSAIAISLSEYQTRVDVENEAQRKWLEEQAKADAKRNAELKAQRERAAAELAVRKAEAKKHWDSLSASQKEAFKKAKGKSARQQALATSSSDTATVFYPLIMAMEFGNINTATSNSIDHCETSSSHSGYSSYSDSGSHSSSSYSSDSGGGGGDSGGGGGGGGE